MYALIIHMLATIGFIALLNDRSHTFNILNEFKNNINSYLDKFSTNSCCSSNKCTENKEESNVESNLESNVKSNVESNVKSNV